MVPAYFIRLLEVPADERAAFDTSSLRLVLHAAVPCPVPVKWQILDALPSAEIWEFYGATEGGATRISPEAWRAHPGSVGTPWPGVEIVILDADGRPVGPGETGTGIFDPTAGRSSGSATTTMPARPMPRGSATRSAWATSVTSTPTATST